MRESVKRAGYIVLSILASIFTVKTGWLLAQIATGLKEGIAPSIFPRTLPLLFSGVLYIDRFAAVFGVILAAVLLITFLQGSSRALKNGLLVGVVVCGVLSAATPLTLVGWLVIALVCSVKNVVPKEWLCFLASMTAIMLSILLLSGGAFLADMTIVASVSSQLPSSMILLALLLLFGGSLWSIRHLEGAYLLIPVYVVLRLCLFFLGSAPALLLTMVSIVATLLALHEARTVRAHTIARSSVYILFMSVPLTMIAVQMQNITAVQCFLFGGLAVAAAGIVADVSVIWPTVFGSWAKRTSIFMRSALPGTFMGMGAILLLGGFFSLGQAVGTIERLYLTLLAIFTLLTFMFMGRKLMMQEVRLSSLAFSGIVQSLLLLAGGVFFAQMLALLGTTIGGDIPDAKIDFVFGATTFSFTPWILCVGGLLIVVLCGVMKKYKPLLWEYFARPIRAGLSWIDAHYRVPQTIRTLRTSVTNSIDTLDASLRSWEDRSLRMNGKESALLLILLFVVTFIVLF